MCLGVSLARGDVCTNNALQTSAADDSWLHHFPPGMDSAELQRRSKSLAASTGSVRGGCAPRMGCGGQWNAFCPSVKQGELESPSATDKQPEISLAKQLYQESSRSCLSELLAHWCLFIFSAGALGQVPSTEALSPQSAKIHNDEPHKYVLVWLT